jgi:hypothetical protein
VTVNTTYPSRRLQYDVGIGYGDDIERARTLGTASNSGSRGKHRGPRRPFEIPTPRIETTTSASCPNDMPKGEFAWGGPSRLANYRLDSSQCATLPSSSAVPDASTVRGAGRLEETQPKMQFTLDRGREVE